MSRIKKKIVQIQKFYNEKIKVKTIFMQRIKVQEIDSEGKTPKQVIC